MKSRLLASAALWLVPACASAQEASSRQSWASETVVVTGERTGYAEAGATTATRTPTPIEKIPQSIQTLTRTLIEEQDLQNLSAALSNVSGVTRTSTMQTVLQPTLVRGFPVTYYFDGMPTYQLPPSAADPGTLVNVERIEVAKGPSSTLFGGGTGAPLAGLINLVSRDATDRFSATAALRGGSFDTIGGEADINIPLGAGLAFRVNGQAETAASYIDVVHTQRYAVFPTLSWAISEDTRLVLRGRYNRLEQDEYSGLPIDLLKPTRLIRPSVYAGANDAPQTSVENKQISAFLSHRFSDWLEGNLAYSHFDNSFEEWATFPYGQIAGTVYNFGNGLLPSTTSKNFVTGSLLARFGSEGFSHQVLAGVDHDHTNYFGAMYFNPAWTVLDYTATDPRIPFGPMPPLFFDQFDRLSSTALFLQDQIGIGESLTLTLGVRWTHLSVDSNTATVPTSDVNDRITPRAGFTYEFIDGLSLFGGYSEGFQGVVGGGFYSIVPKPETSQSYEAGFKLASPIEGLTGTLAFYRIARQNVLTSDPVIPFAYVQAGEQRSRGFETDLVYEPDPTLSVLFNYTYTDASVTEDNTLPVGDRLRAVPMHSGRLAVRYRFLDDETLHGLEVGAGATAVSKRELTLPNTLSVGGQILFDLQASYDLGPALLSLSVVNLFDSEVYDPYQYFGGPYVSPTQPRSAYLTIRHNF